jgi:CubicO group peptidase (beta-lactamase class C family)
MSERLSAVILENRDGGNSEACRHRGRTRNSGPPSRPRPCSISKAISALAAVIAFENHKLGIDENIDDILSQSLPAQS